MGVQAGGAIMVTNAAWFCSSKAEWRGEHPAAERVDPNAHQSEGTWRARQDNSDGGGRSVSSGKKAEASCNDAGGRGLGLEARRGLAWYT